MSINLKMSEKIRFTSEDGNIQYTSLTEEYLEESLDLLETTFFVQETVSVVCGLPEDAEGRSELRELCTAIAKYGVSIIAIDVNLNKVSGIALNLIQTKGDIFYEQFSDSFKKSSSRDYLQCMIDVDCAMNLFEKTNSTCYLELLFLATHPQYQGREIATNLTKVSIDMARELKKRNLNTEPLDSTVMAEHTPSIIIAIFTSGVSQKIGKKCGLEVITRIPYKDIKINTKSYYDLLGKKQGEIIATYKQL